MLKTASVLDLIGVTKRFTAPDGVSALTAIERVSLTVRAGEFVAVVGPSGCGKSTILNLVAGLDRPSEGRIMLNGVPVEGPNPTVGFMLQKDLLLPWRTIVHNVEFGLEARAISRAERRERALRELQRCRLHGFRAELSLSVVRRHAAARGARAHAWRSSRRSCCWTSRSPRSTRRPSSSCRRASPQTIASSGDHDAADHP